MSVSGNFDAVGGAANAAGPAKAGAAESSTGQGIVGAPEHKKPSSAAEKLGDNAVSYSGKKAEQKAGHVAKKPPTETTNEQSSKAAPGGASGAHIAQKPPTESTNSHRAGHIGHAPPPEQINPNPQF